MVYMFISVLEMSVWLKFKMSYQITRFKYLVTYKFL